MIVNTLLLIDFILVNWLLLTCNISLHFKFWLAEISTRLS